ncbi:MAG: excinuclease ABC subunit UvrB [Synergistaceae bacterium]|nr:excinuclease ABC subunit UvrB [Synergistaceae bacterium]
MEEEKFILHSEYELSEDQAKATESIVQGFLSSNGHTKQTLLGVTGSGKTFTMANVIARLNRPTLVLAHNKTLAAQLYSEFKGFFPENSVNYFVSYYDYYQPEAYIPATDAYIEKDASVNEKIEKLRLACTKSLLERNDCVVVASVSCIYGLGVRKNYEDAIFRFAVGDIIDRRSFMSKLITSYYTRNDTVLQPSTFRVRGESLEIYPSYSDTIYRVEFFDDEIERITELEPLTGAFVADKKKVGIFPAQHYVTNQDAIATSKDKILEEMEKCCQDFLDKNMPLEAERLRSRTLYDMEMLTEVGYCSGIENYSVYLDGRNPGEPPGTLLDFFPKNSLYFVDESHITIPQVRGMFNGDRARKNVLVQFGFRLPSCLDNRPLMFDEFESRVGDVLFTSATPGDYELENSKNVVEQLMRPTGIPDPVIEVRSATGQVDDLIGEIKQVTESGDRVLALTLTKRQAEDLSEFLAEVGIKSRYIHSEMDTFERADMLKELRTGGANVLVGVNLLREGIDLPEVSLIAILDADKEGFLRNTRSLIQMIGRTARNANGRVILYGDVVTASMDSAIKETNRRRKLQLEYNEAHGIIPQTVKKAIKNLLPVELQEEGNNAVANEMTVKQMEEEMWLCVEKLDFERAAELRDKILQFKGQGQIKKQPSKKKRRAKYRTRK